MLLEGTYFLDLYLLSTLALMITAIVQCWLTDRIKLKKIIWTVAIVATYPFCILGTIIFAFVHYRTWRKIIPLSMVLILGSGAYFQLMEWGKNNLDTVTNLQSYDALLQGKEGSTVSETDQPLLYGWIEDASLKMLNLNKADYKSSLEANRHLFTQDGYESYYKALESSHIIAGLESGDLDIVFERNNSPVQAYINSHDQPVGWIINVPGKLYYSWLQGSKSQNVMVSVFVKRDSGAFKATRIIVSPDS